MEDSNENWMTEDTDHYIALMRIKFIPGSRRKRRVDMDIVIYQEDGAPFNCSDFPWPPYSPALNPGDFFLWGYLKERIYDNNPKTLVDLKDNIRREIRCIPADMIGRVINNFNVRVAAIVHQRCTWIEHIINY